MFKLVFYVLLKCSDWLSNVCTGLAASWWCGIWPRLGSRSGVCSELRLRVRTTAGSFSTWVLFSCGTAESCSSAPPWTERWATCFPPKSSYNQQLFYLFIFFIGRVFVASLNVRNLCGKLKHLYFEVLRNKFFKLFKILSLFRRKTEKVSHVTAPRGRGSFFIALKVQINLSWIVFDGCSMLEHLCYVSSGLFPDISGIYDV